jgi:hypothetical protein
MDFTREFLIDGKYVIIRYFYNKECTECQIKFGGFKIGEHSIPGMGFGDSLENFVKEFYFNGKQND